MSIISWFIYFFSNFFPMLSLLQCVIFHIFGGTVKVRNRNVYLILYYNGISVAYANDICYG